MDMGKWFSLKEEGGGVTGTTLKYIGYKGITRQHQESTMAREKKSCKKKKIIKMWHFFSDTYISSFLWRRKKEITLGCYHWETCIDQLLFPHKPVHESHIKMKICENVYVYITGFFVFVFEERNEKHKMHALFKVILFKREGENQ